MSTLADIYSVEKDRYNDRKFRIVVDVVIFCLLTTPIKEELLFSTFHLSKDEERRISLAAKKTYSQLRKCVQGVL